MKILRSTNETLDKSLYEKCNIAEVNHGNKVCLTGILLVQTRTTKSGYPYFLITVKDNTGAVSQPVWNSLDLYKSLSLKDNESFVEVYGTISTSGAYKNLSADGICFVEKEQEDLDEEAVKSGFPTIEDLKNELNVRVGKISNSFLKQVVLTAIKNHTESISESPFSEKTAYCYKGGLLHQMIDICDITSSVVESINCSFWSDSLILDEDLMLTGALLCNLGKIKTLKMNENGMVEKTLLGQFEGDSIYSREITSNAIDSVIESIKENEKELSEDKKTNLDTLNLVSVELLHLISSSKNSVSFGAVSTPRSKHAAILSSINNIAFSKGMFEFLEKNTPKEELFSKPYDNGKNYYIGKSLE